MYQSIQTKLHQIATSEPLHLLLAVESGSRAWGFPSPDSDYDVRAIYIKQPENYLCIDEQKDTFEYIENQWFDVGGWDIRKALRLLRKSNAVLLEWLRSPIVYAQDDEFVHTLAELAPQYAVIFCHRVSCSPVVMAACGVVPHSHANSFVRQIVFLSARTL